MLNISNYTGVKYDMEEIYIVVKDKIQMNKNDFNSILVQILPYRRQTKKVEIS